MVYLVPGLFWGVYAATKQLQQHPKSSRFSLFLTFALNAVIWPISIIVASIVTFMGTETLADLLNRRHR